MYDMNFKCDMQTLNKALKGLFTSKLLKLVKIYPIFNMI